MDNSLLIEYCKAVRESTLKRLEIVPEGYENWKPSPGALSFAEVAKHLIDIDNWLIEKIKNPGIKSIETQTAAMKYCDRARYNKLISELKKILETKIEFIKTLDKERLSTIIFDDSYNSEVSITWLILRRNLDHEAHHRGQIALYLRLLKDKNTLQKE